MTYGATNPELQNKLDEAFTAILVEQSKFMTLKSADPQKVEETSQLLESYGQLRGRGFFYPYLATGRGHGPFTECTDGSIKYDLIGGIGPNLLGHSHPLYIKSHLEAAALDSVMCGNLQPYPQTFELSELLINAVSDSKLKHFWYAGSGSFANDTALKMVWQKRAPAYKLIAFEDAFAGRSVATQDITYNAAYRDGMPKKVEVDHIPHFDINDPEGSKKRTLEVLRNLLEENEGEYSAMMIEIVQGEAGIVAGSRDFYVEIFELAKSHGLYIWIDEVQSFARTHKLFAFQHFNLEEYVDIVTVGKALQVCGVLFSNELNPKPGLVSGTFNGSLSAVLAGKKIVRYLTEGNFFGDSGRIAQLEQAFLTRIEKLSNGSCKGKIGRFEATGVMVAFQVGEGSKESTSKFLKKLFQNGIIAFSAGKDPVRVRFLPPLCLDEDHLDEIFSIVEKTILEVES
ncbi:MAG: aminotransferase class III-fold pyridoxal phosphate-dependent enzyme [Bacteriovoracaceae bacterium]|nr:aminotransferase class III-fold pyridoxal phosphate-dependent enzyme [Bacteriovoracaceae bacterium]